MRGVVIKSTGSHYAVRNGEGAVITCRIKGKLRLDDIKSTNPVAVGDLVNYEIDEETEGEGVIYEILPRRNYVVRKATNLSKQTQILASNVDQAILVVTINYPVTTATFIDRFLVTAEAYDVPVIIVFNKLDRYDTRHLEDLWAFKQIYVDMGYDVIEISAKEEIGLSQVKERLTGKISVIAGHSGVGKSTLINKIEPGLNLRTSEISESNNTGRHTTTYAEMHAFSFGGYIIDTPGIRGFGIADIEKAEISHYFRDIFLYSKNCQYHNCTHTHEANCAVKDAVEEGQIARSRYQSYLNIFGDDGERYR